jgi:6-phosphogluconolactonase
MNKKEIFADAYSLYTAAANFIIELANKSILKNGRFCMALSGGNTPRKLYELLARPGYSNLLDWKNIFVFWSDERCLPISDNDNNSHMAFHALLNHVPIPAENIFPVPVNFAPQRAAASYEATIQTFFKAPLPQFDLIMLGLGENGHTASLFPFSSILTEKEHIVKDVFIDELKNFRISFTVPLINHAKHILFLVSGKEKATILKIIFSGNKHPEEYPAQLIKPVNGNTYWYIDKDAATQLKIKK